MSSVNPFFYGMELVSKIFSVVAVIFVVCLIFGGLDIVGWISIGIAVVIFIPIMILLDKRKKEREKEYDPLAQSVEHMTFNHGVRSSSPRWVTKQNKSELFRRSKLVRICFLGK